nr:hypothetical protein [uncultured Brevundimonas sp.]
MAIDIIHLRNLMRLILAEPALETRLLRTNIREELARQRGDGEGGMDFYTPFWADAKAHARGGSNLRDQTELRVRASAQRRNLYPLLRDGFLTWWEERRRRRNEPFTILNVQVRGRFTLDGVGVIRVENNLAFRIGDDGLRVVYPYFNDEPEITADMARIGLWAMSQALPQYSIQDMRILDVVRGRSYSIEEAPQSGSEQRELSEAYAALIDRWNILRASYD